jgi:hypothetical protein
VCLCGSKFRGSKFCGSKFCGSKFCGSKFFNVLANSSLWKVSAVACKKVGWKLNLFRLR